MIYIIGLSFWLLFMIDSKRAFQRKGKGVVALTSRLIVQINNCPTVHDGVTSNQLPKK
jgi:hypothetical protein